MEQQTEGIEMLELVPNPVFCAAGGVIVRLNTPARKLFLREGLRIAPLFASGKGDYDAFSGGMLYLTVVIYGQRFGASVTRIGQEDVFTLDQPFDSEELRTLALAARELRAPLSNAMLSAQSLPEESEAASKLTRNLYQLLRIIGNMSDAAGLSPVFRPESQNVTALFQEIAEKAINLSASTGHTVTYSGLNAPCACCVDRQMMERAALNMLSNALKFTPAGGTIELSLRRNGEQFRFSVSDSGSGIPSQEQSSLFRRYLRQPAIEDIRHGIGLGMVLIRNTAAHHSGAVLVDHPNGSGTRVTITFSSAPEEQTQLRSKLLSADYAGEQDHALVELSEFLPYDIY